jgi:zinc protease
MKSLLASCCLIFSVSLAQASTLIQHWTHSSGALIYLVEATSIPMVDLQIDWAAGSVNDPIEKLGLASMTAGMIDKGARLPGNRILSEAEIADRLADLGANLSFSSSAERSSMRLRSLSEAKKLNAVIDLAGSILKAPIFDGKILKREQERTVAAIRESDIKPEVILAKEFDRQMYGQHPFANSVKVNTILAINQNDLKSFFQSRYAAKGSKVTIVGDISRAQADQLIGRLMTALPATQKLSQSVPAVNRFDASKSNHQIIKISHESQQAHISMGMPAIARKDPDYFPMLVGNYILGGGGFVSRLVKEVREKRGLAYSVYSYVSPGRQIGPFVAGMQTQKSQADIAVEVMKKTIGDFIENGPNDDELQAAKNNLINGFPLRIDSNRKILDNVASIAWNELPLDTLDQWTLQLKAVTKEQVIAAFKKNLDANKIVTVVVGAP